VTGSSNSVSGMFTPLLTAAATMREMLISQAASKLAAPSGQLKAENGIVFSIDDPGIRLTYGEIVAEVTEWEVPETLPTLKPVNKYRVIGQSRGRVDLLEKIAGKAVYGYDARLPDMLYGAVARPPVMGAELISASPGNARGSAGVVEIVTRDGFAGIAATSRLEAFAALSDLDLNWSKPRLWQQEELEAMATVGQGYDTLIQKEGLDVEDDFNTGTLVEADYRTPFAAHAHLEPQAALANVLPDKVEIWTATQAPWSVQSAVAEALDRETETVHVYPTFLGGAFGRRVGSDVAVEAAILSEAANRPVHVGWDRTEEFQNGFLRPPTHSKFRASLNNNGTIAAIEHQQASGDVAFPFVPGFLTAIMGADFGAWRGATIRYGIPNRQTIAWRTELPVPTGWWRGLGLLANVFSIESFIDELAHAAGADPLEFRLKHLPPGTRRARYNKVLETVAEKSGWGSSLPPGRARGIAMCDDVQTIVAQVAEVSIEDGNIRVHKVTAAMDCGLVINPDGAQAQAQGSIMMGLSSTLKEEAIIRDSRVTASNFGGYPLLTMAEAPDLDITLIESGNQPFGVGEPPIGPIAAAVANAVFTLTGQRLRTLPLKLN
jgi:isoquinoline 1-oxidoreductase beta subunit